MSSKYEGAASPALAGSAAQAARPDTPSGVDARSLHRSPKSAVSRSVDLGSFNLHPVPISPSGRNPTAPNLGLPDPEFEQRSSSGGLVPQPPSVGSPAVVGSSPRMRSVSSRSLSLSVRASLSVSQLPEGAEDAADGPELCLSQSPKLAAAPCPLTPDMPAHSPVATAGATKAGRRSAPLSQQLPLTPAGAAAALRAAASPAEAASAERRATPGAAVASPGAAASPGADSETDPWVALREHCIATYGADASSDDDSDGYARPGRFMLMRHPSLVTRSLGRSFEEPARADVPHPAPSATRPGQRNSPDGKDKAAASSSATAAAAVEATAVASGPPVKAPAPAWSSPATRPTGSQGAAAAGIPGLSPGRSPPASATPRAGAAPAAAACRAGGAAASGAAPDLSGAALSRARLAAAATMQLQCQSPPPGAAAGSVPMPSFPPPSPSQSPAAAAPAPHRSESGTSSTASSAAAGEVLGMPPRARQPSGGGGGSSAAARAGASASVGADGSGGGACDSPFATTAASAAALAAISYPAVEHLGPSPPKPPPQRQQSGGGAGRSGSGAVGAAAEGDGLAGSGEVSALLSLGIQLQQELTLNPLEVDSLGGINGTLGALGGADDRRVSESGGVAVAVGSILDVAPLNADPIRKRRLSADGLNRHASKYGAGGGGVGCGSSDGAASTPVTPGVVDGVAVVVARSAPVAPDSGGVAGGGGGGSVTPAAASPSGGGTSSSPSASSGRAPLISALAFERAPWSAHPTSAAAAGNPPTGGPVSPATHGATKAAGVKLFRPPHPPSPPAARLPGLPLGPPPQRPHLALGLSAPFDRASDVAAAAAAAGGVVKGISGGGGNATAVDKLRGYKSSKVLLGAVPLSTSSNTPAPVVGPAATETSPTAATGLSPPAVRPPLGPFASMRTLRTPATASAAASFLERLSSSSGLVGSGGPNRISSRRTIGGGSGGGAAGGAGDWASEAGNRRSFRRREGSCSMDGSGCDGLGSGSGSGSVPPQAASDAGPVFARGAGGPAPGRDWSSPAGAGPVAGLHARRSYKQLLPRGPNGLPLAWSAIEEEGREGSDGGREEHEGAGEGGGGSKAAGGEAAGALAGWQHAVTDKEGEGVGGEEEEEEEGFNVARGGGWIDLHRTC